ncbi:MAG: WXG100 family type VII secretion target [Prevotellaceae bacterium]|nr:WXG100 family type VII secretion target [Candidatus Minthosoma equi]
MAADTGMRNIAEVEQYSKNLENISMQVTQVFQRLKQQTEQISQNWHDSQFQLYKEQFDQNITKEVEGICGTLQKLSIYAKKQCEFHRMAQQHHL